MSDGAEPIADQYSCTESIVERSPEAYVISNLGVSTFILAAVEDRERNFYLRGAMGSTTAVGLGLSLTIDDQVTVIDGDGSMLMSLGTLATVGRHDPENLVVVVMDNSRFETTGGQPSLSSEVDIAAVAKQCGLQSYHARTNDGFRERYDDAVDHDGAAVVVAEVTSERPEEFPPIDYPHSYLKKRFTDSVDT